MCIALRTLACVAVGLPGLVSGAQLIVNGSFSDGLNGWSSNGSVSETSGFALVQEEGVGGTSAVFQSVSVGSEALVLSFELFVGGMSTTVPQGLLADTVFGTLYFGNSAFGNDASSGSFDEQLALFDLDRDGVRELAPGTTRQPIPGRTDWERFELSFVSTMEYVTFVIESVDLNGGAEPDSVVAVDEVSITVVPEPTSLILLFPGVLLLIRRARAP